jgi:hypothetical protein
LLRAQQEVTLVGSAPVSETVSKAGRENTSRSLTAKIFTETRPLHPQGAALNQQLAQLPFSLSAAIVLLRQNDPVLLILFSMKISMRKVFMSLIGAIAVFAGLVTFVELYRPSISESELGFLKTQKRPLTAEALAKRFGHSEIGPGFYEYPIRGGNKRAEFWIGPPRPPPQGSASGFPVEIVVVVVRSGRSDARIIWPEEMKEKQFDEVISSFWPQKE